MTFHVYYDHQCGRCGAEYIPSDDVPCPQCGLVEAERFDYIPRAAALLHDNRSLSRSYAPGGWWVSSLADRLLLILFGLFDRFERDRSSKPFAEYAGDYLDRMDWEKRLYLRDHVLQIA